MYEELTRERDIYIWFLFSLACFSGFATMATERLCEG
jgi:hypothetical protein